MSNIKEIDDMLKELFPGNTKTNNTRQHKDMDDILKEMEPEQTDKPIEQLENEIFHIIHSIIWEYNENRPTDQQIRILDKTMGVMAEKIAEYITEKII